MRARLLTYLALWSALTGIVPCFADTIHVDATPDHERSTGLTPANLLRA